MGSCKSKVDPDEDQTVQEQSTEATAANTRKSERQAFESRRKDMRNRFKRRASNAADDNKPEEPKTDASPGHHRSHHSKESPSPPSKHTHTGKRHTHVSIEDNQDSQGATHKEAQKAVPAGTATFSGSSSKSKHSRKSKHARGVASAANLPVGNVDGSDAPPTTKHSRSHRSTTSIPSAGAEGETSKVTSNGEAQPAESSAADASTASLSAAVPTKIKVKKNREKKEEVVLNGDIAAAPAPVSASVGHARTQFGNRDSSGQVSRAAASAAAAEAAMDAKKEADLAASKALAKRKETIDLRGPPEDVCGISISVCTLCDMGGYMVEATNPSSETARVDADFAASKNLQFRSWQSQGVNIGPVPSAFAVGKAPTRTDLQCSLVIPPNDVRSVWLVPVDPTAKIHVDYMFSRSADVKEKTLSSKIVLHTCTFPFGTGYGLALENPTQTAYTVTFSFEKAVNLCIPKAAAGTSVDGMKVSMIVTPNFMGEFATLCRVNNEEPTKLTYDISTKVVKEKKSTS